MVDREAFYRNIVHSLRNGVIAIWRDGSMAVVNDAAYHILELDADPAHIGRSFHDVLGKDHDLADVLARAFTDAELPNRAELRLRSSGKAIGYTLSRILDRDGAVSGAVLLAEGDIITKDDLRLGDLTPTMTGSTVASVVKIPPTGVPLEEIERQAVVEALTMSNWVQKDAAELLSITPRVMNYKVKTLNIEMPRHRRAPPP
jgi:transcriptional regulator with PAS, ATPase and Fis domain